MKNVLVTGANGQLGQSLQSVSRDFKNIKFQFHSRTSLDITNAEHLKAYFSQNKIDYCVNCAAYTAVDNAEDDEKQAFLINADAVKILADVCKSQKVVLIHISTDFVFDGEKDRPYFELDATNPINVYGASKLKGEQIIRGTLSSYFIIRTSWVYSEFGSNFVKTMLRLSEDRNSLDIVDDQIGTPTYARDLAIFICIVISAKEKAFGIYHFSNIGECSWYEFARKIFVLNGKSFKVNGISSASFNSKAKRPANSLLSKNKALDTFDISIRQWEDSLQDMLSRLGQS